MPLADAEYRCSRCGRVAARVSLVDAGEPTPEPVLTTATPDGEAVMSAMLRLVIDAVGFGGSTGGGVVSERRDVLSDALRSGDPAALYAVDREAAPFWCPTCQAVYGGECWEQWDVFDDDWTSWFDERRGRCPRGHERTLFD
jgi:hypothetical protein